MALWTHQQSAADAAKKWMKGSLDRQIIILPTGAGKSHVAAHIAEWFVEKSGKKVLVTAPSGSWWRKTTKNTRLPASGPIPTWSCVTANSVILEGVRSEVDYLGRQPIVYNLRSDSIGESSLAFALRSGIGHDTRSALIASNLLEWVYSRCGLFTNTPASPSWFAHLDARLG